MIEIFLSYFPFYPRLVLPLQQEHLPLPHENLSFGGPASSCAFSTCALTKAGQSVKEGNYFKKKLSKSSI